MKLTDIEIRKAAAGEAPVILRDEFGLYLEISPAGLRSWRLRIRAGGSNSRLTLGHYPKMSLAAARKARDSVRAGQPVDGQGDSPPAPVVTVRAAAAEWHETNRSRWGEKHAANVLGSLEREVFPIIGDDDVRAVTAPRVKHILKGIEARGVMDHAHDIRQRIEAVFRYAKSSGYCDSNPAADMRDVLKALPKATPRPAVVTLDEAKTCLGAAESIPAMPITRLAMRFLALTAQRPGEVRAAEWSEFSGLDGAAPVWRIPAEHMKMKRAHEVPLSPAAVETLEALHRLSGKSPLAFPAFDDAQKPISEGALGEMLERAGYKGRHVPHGWRAAFSTIMNGRRPADRAVIDLMLAHESKDKVEAAYNRQTHWSTRVEIAAEWAKLIMKGRPPAAALLNLPKRSPRVARD